MGGALRSIAWEGVPRHGRQVVGDAAEDAALTTPTPATGINPLSLLNMTSHLVRVSLTVHTLICWKLSRNYCFLPNGLVGKCSVCAQHVPFVVLGLVLVAYSTKLAFADQTTVKQLYMLAELMRLGQCGCVGTHAKMLHCYHLHGNCETASPAMVLFMTGWCRSKGLTAWAVMSMARQPFLQSPQVWAAAELRACCDITLLSMS